MWVEYYAKFSPGLPTEPTAARPNSAGASILAENRRFSSPAHLLNPVTKFTIRGFPTDGRPDAEAAVIDTDQTDQEGMD